MTGNREGRGLWQGAASNAKGNYVDHSITGCSPIDRLLPR
jgi:hypothetical protein